MRPAASFFAERRIRPRSCRKETRTFFGTVGGIVRTNRGNRWKEICIQCDAGARTELWASTVDCEKSTWHSRTSSAQALASIGDRKRFCTRALAVEVCSICLLCSRESVRTVDGSSYFLVLCRLDHIYIPRCCLKCYFVDAAHSWTRRSSRR